MDIKEIQSLIKFVAKSGASEVKLETDDIKITIRTGSSGGGETTYVQQIPVPAQPVAPIGQVPAAPVSDQAAQTTRQGVVQVEVRGVGPLLVAPTATAPR